MSIARVFGCVPIGVEGHVIEVEGHVSDGLISMNVTGLADASVNESKDRVRAAMINVGCVWPQRRITVGLSPASLPKHGSGLDLPIAIAIASADQQISNQILHESMFFGELSLDGRVRQVPGALLAAISAKESGCKRIVLSIKDADIARLVSEIEVIGVSHLSQVLNLCGGEFPTMEFDENCETELDQISEHTENYNQVKGQTWAKFAFEVAAAGGHHLAILGPPGVGKTLLAERLPSILPKLSKSEALEVAAIRSATSRSGSLNYQPPFAAPHHTSSYTSLIGGGSGVPVVGLITQAHRGVLFLDEAPEFATNVLDALRQPLESGKVSISRRTFKLELPARFQLVLAANPCPCGHALDPNGRCQCTPTARRRYLGRISGPLMDRVDIRIVVDPPTAYELDYNSPQAEDSTEIRKRVENAIQKAQQRLRETHWKKNAEIPSSAIRELFPLQGESNRRLNRYLVSSRASARGIDRIARLAWTVADLQGHANPEVSDVETAIKLREADGRWLI